MLPFLSLLPLTLPLVLSQAVLALWTESSEWPLALCVFAGYRCATHLRLWPRTHLWWTEHTGPYWRIGNIPMVGWKEMEGEGERAEKGEGAGWLGTCFPKAAVLAATFRQDQDL